MKLDNSVAIKLHQSISFLLARTGVLIAFMFGILISAYQIYIDYQDQEGELSQTVEQIIRVSESSAVQAVYEYDEALAKRVINGLFEYSPIVFVKITDDFGEPLAQASRQIKTQRPWWLPDEVLAGQKQFQILLITQDSIDNSRAQLIVTVDIYQGTSGFVSRSITILLSGIVRNILLAGALLFVFHLLISKPLIELIDHLTEIDPEKPDSELTVAPRHQNDELNLLAMSINRLLKSVVDHIEQVNNINDHLEQRVSERTQELVAMSKESLASLEKLKDTQLQLVEAEKNAALSGMVAGIAHEINTPVGVTVTAVSSLEASCHEISKKMKSGSITRVEFEHFIAKSIETSKIIQNNTHRAAELISSFKQVAVDQSSDERRKFDLGEYIKEVILSLKPHLKKTQIRLIIDCEPDIIMDSYPGAVAQIISNLVINAALHAYDEGDSGEIKITVWESEGIVYLDFCDDGKGIEEEHLSQIFNPFFTTKRGHGGSGLGLHIISNIVTNSLQGRIHCESQLGLGCCFKIWFPARIETADIDSKDSI